MGTGTSKLNRNNYLSTSPVSAQNQAKLQRNRAMTYAKAAYGSGVVKGNMSLVNVFNKATDERGSIRTIYSALNDAAKPGGAHRPGFNDKRKREMAQSTLNSVLPDQYEFRKTANPDLGRREWRLFYRFK